jgi:bifunctional DNA-binding transcriptional regulator/antitoxin component of YhaV-PrlF toxin-antitoxin module
MSKYLREKYKLKEPIKLEVIEEETLEDVCLARDSHVYFVLFSFLMLVMTSLMDVMVIYSSSQQRLFVPMLISLLYFHYVFQ